MAKTFYPFQQANTQAFPCCKQQSLGSLYSICYTLGPISILMKNTRLNKALEILLPKMKASFNLSTEKAHISPLCDFSVWLKCK